MALNMNSVVLAEDDLEISSMVKDYFEQAYGLSVTTTDKVDGIIPLVLKTKASVLIMDLELKDGDASQVVSDVAGINGLVVIIFNWNMEGKRRKQTSQRWGSGGDEETPEAIYHLAASAKSKRCF